MTQDTPASSHPFDPIPTVRRRRWRPGRAGRRSAGLVALATLVGAVAPAVAPTSSVTAEEVPDPIEPTAGEAQLLELIDGLPLNDIEQALDNFPIPYVVVASAGASPPTIANQHVGAPVRIDADQSNATGQGGNDIKVEVNTELDPTPHLVLDIERLGAAPYADDLSIAVVFPFSAFNDEGLPAAPNVFFGYSSEYGQAPQSVEMVLTPGVLAGTSHLVDMDITTVGDVAPVRFVGGHFDGDPGAAPVNAMAFAAEVFPVPDQISLGLDVNMSPIAIGGPTSSQVTLDWAATQPAHVMFDYLENEAYPFATPDYGTSVIVDQMPTQASIGLTTDFVAGTVGVSHQASAPIDDLRIGHTREDGFVLRVVAEDVPTEVDVVVGTSGTASLDVNDDTLDLTMGAMQLDGFPGTGGFFGYPIGYVELGLENAPDLTAAWDAATTSFSAQTTVPGTSVDRIEMIIDDVALMTPSGVAFGRQLPDAWNLGTRHIVSLIDDGTHGAAAARAVDVEQVDLGIASAPVAAHTALTTGAATPLHANVETSAESAIIGEDVDVRCNVEDVPAGLVTLDLGFPPPTIDIAYTAVPAAGIESVDCAGSVGTLNFEIGLGNVPAEFDIQFDPDSSLDVLAGNGVAPAPSAQLGRAFIHLWDADGIAGLPDTSGLLGVPLRDAIAQVDDVPSFSADWSDDAAGTSVVFDTVAAAGPWQYLGGAQVQVSTEVGLTTPLDEPTADTRHYLTLVDQGVDAPKQLMAGVFGIDTVALSTADGAGQRSIEAHYAADADRALIVNVDSEFGGRFFPDYRVDATLLVEDVPRTWDFFTDLTSTIDIEASSRVDRIAMQGSISTERELPPPPPPPEGEEPPPVVRVFDTTELFAQLQGIPTSLDYLVDLSPEGEAHLHLSDQLDLISVEVYAEASNGTRSTILGTDYGHLRLIAEDVPAGFDAGWGSIAGGLQGELTTTTPLGPVEFVVSRADRGETSARRQYLDGGAVEYTPFTREIDRRYWRQGEGDDAAREAIFMNRLDALYDTEIGVDPDEDHLVMFDNVLGELEFLSVRGSGFQQLTFENTDVLNAELIVPVEGDHPFFLGMRQAGVSTIVQIPNIPDTTTIELGAQHAEIQFDEEPGDIVFYRGPRSGADVYTTEMTKVLVDDAPTSISASWQISDDVSLDVDVSNPTVIQMISQNGSGRKVVDVEVDDISASWSTGEWETEWAFGPAGWGLYTFITRAELDIDTGSPLSGMIATYERAPAPQSLDGDWVPKEFVEMVPRVTALFDGFTGVHGTSQSAVCSFGACVPGVPVYWATFGVDVDSLMVDVWDRGHPHIGLLGDPDYVDGDPWHLYPVFGHDNQDHILPEHMFSL